jgi:hypothetical protein
MVFLINHFYKTRDDETIYKYFDKVSVEHLKQKSNQTDLNILEILSSHGSKINEISYLVKHNHGKEDMALLKIYEYIISRKPELITEQCFILAKAMNNKAILEMLNKYKLKLLRSSRHYNRDYSKLSI